MPDFVIQWTGKITIQSDNGFCQETCIGNADVMPLCGVWNQEREWDKDECAYRQCDKCKEAEINNTRPYRHEGEK